MIGVKQQLSRVSPLTITLIILFAAAMTYLVIRAFAATGAATLYTSPGGTQSVTTGQTFAVNVRISTAADTPVVCADLVLSYPASKLQVISQNYSGSPYNDQIPPSDSGGALHMVRCQSPGANIVGDQQFAQVTFKALATGAASIGFTDSSVVTSYSGNNIVGLSTQKSGVTYNVSAPASPSSNSGGTSSGSGSSSSGGSSSNGNSKGNSGSKPPSSGSSAGNSSAGGNNSSNDNNGSTTSSSDGSQSGSITDSSTATSTVLITIVDSHNKPVAGAEVTIGGQTVKTDKNGIARFSGVPAGNQAIAVKYNGKKTSKTLDVKGVSTQSPELFKVSIVRDKFNPALLVVPIIILLAAGGYILRPWRFALAGNNTGAAESTPTPVTSSDSSAGKPETPSYRKLETPGTVYSPTPSDNATPTTPKDNSKK